MLMTYTGFSDDRYCCPANVYDSCIGNSPRLLCSFSAKPWQRSNVRACEDDRVTGTTTLMSQGIGNILAHSKLQNNVNLWFSLGFVDERFHLPFVKTMHQFANVFSRT